MIKFDSEICNVIFHGETTGADGTCVVPFEVNAGVQVSLPVFCDFVVLLKDTFQMEGVAFAHVLDAKVVNEQAKHNRTPFVAPEAGGGGARCGAPGT